MAVDKVATRYAKGFIDFLGSPDAVLATVKELHGFHEAVESHPELKVALTTGIFSAAERRFIVEDVAKHIGLSAKTTRLLLMLSQRKRISAVKAIASSLKNLVLTAGGIVPMDVTSSDELSSDDKRKLEQKFSEVLGKKVEANYHKDDVLLGGLRVIAGGRTFDGSLSGWLTSMEEVLIGGSR